MRWNRSDKRHSNKHKGDQDKFQDSDTAFKASKSGTKKSKKHQDPTISSKDNGDSQFQCSMDDCHFSRGSSLLSRTTSRRSHTPTPSLQRTGSQSASSGKMDSFRRSISTRATTSTNLSTSSENPTNSNNMSKLMSQKSMKSPTAATIANVASLSKSTSRRSTTPIIFSQSTARRKPQPIEMKLECSLEELCFGALKQVNITKDVISDVGMIVQEEETLQVDIKPGFKTGTKITFEGKGDEKPGYLPADIIFLIEEKRHPMFKRIDDDLELGVQVPLLKALVGCNITVPLLGGEKMNLAFDDVIHPGYEKIIPNQGMPKEVGERGDLRLKFLVDFPRQLSVTQRSNICTILEGCFLSENN